MTMGEGGTGERVRAFQLVTAAIALIRPRLRSLGVVVAVGWAINLAWTIYATPRAAELGFVRELIAALLGGVTGALMIRTMLVPAERWWRPDSGFLGYVALSTVVGLPLVYFLAQTGTPSPTDQPEPRVLFFQMLLIICTLILSVKLQLWFVGVLIDRFCGPAESWRRMRGAMMAFILANLFMSLPLMTVLVLVAGLGGETATNVASPTAAVLMLGMVVAEVLAASVSAALWKVRGTEG